MDESRLKKLCQEALDISYPVFTIEEFRALPTEKFDEEKNEWVHLSYSLFIMLKKKPMMDYKEPFHNFSDVEKFLESFFGFEFCVDFV